MGADRPAGVAHRDIDGPVTFREWDGPPETTFLLVHGLGGST